MRIGGITNKNFKNIYLGNKEILNSLKKNKLKPVTFFFLYKILRDLNSIYQHKTCQLS